MKLPIQKQGQRRLHESVAAAAVAAVTESSPEPLVPQIPKCPSSPCSKVNLMKVVPTAKQRADTVSSQWGAAPCARTDPGSRKSGRSVDRGGVRTARDVVTDSCVVVL